MIRQYTTNLIPNKFTEKKAMAKIVVLNLDNSNLVDLDNQQAEEVIGGSLGGIGGGAGALVGGLLNGKRGRALLRDINIGLVGGGSTGLLTGAIGGSLAGGIGALPGAAIGAALV